MKYTTEKAISFALKSQLPIHHRQRLWEGDSIYQGDKLHNPAMEVESKRAEFGLAETKGAGDGEAQDVF